MPKNKEWQLRPGVKMDEESAEQVAKMAVALKSLSLYASLVIEQDDCPEDLQQAVDEGIAAIGKIFVD